MKKICIIGLLTLTICSCNSNNEDSAPNILKINLDVMKIEKKASSFHDFYDSLKIIPLETTLNTFLKNIYRLKVTANDLYVMGDAEHDNMRVLHYDKFGKYINSIGAVGHGRGEYTFLYDFTPNAKGDTIVILDISRILVYNDKGEFLFSKNMSEYGQEFKEVESFPFGGYVGGSFHSNSDYLIHVINKDMNVVDNFVKNTGGYSNAPYVSNSIKIYDDKIYSFDNLTAELSVVDLRTKEEKKYAFISQNVPTIELINEHQNDDREYDGIIKNFSVEDGIVSGDISYNNESLRFELNTVNDNFVMYNGNMDFNVEILATMGDYCYSIMPSSYLLSLVEDVQDSTLTAKMFYDAYSQLNDTISELSNDVILKLHKRRK